MKDAKVEQIVQLSTRYEDFLTFVPGLLRENGAVQKGLFLKLVLAAAEATDKKSGSRKRSCGL
jgi:hypothetical protein